MQTHRLIIPLLSFGVLFSALSNVAEDAGGLSANLRTDASHLCCSFSECEPSLTLPRTNWNVGVTAGTGFGVKVLGGTMAHDLTTATLHVGRFLD